MLFFFFFTKSEEMSRVGSRDRHTWWRSKIHDDEIFFAISNGINWELWLLKNYVVRKLNWEAGWLGRVKQENSSQDDLG